MTMDDRSHHLFELLERLGQLEGEELLGHFTEENVNALKATAGLLKEELELDRYLSETKFVQMVGELCELKRMWSGKLKETLENAGEVFERGEMVQAMWILNGFIRFCPAPHYRGIAERVLERYSED